MNGLQKLDVSFNPNLFYLPKVNISEYISRMIQSMIVNTHFQVERKLIESQPPCLLHLNISSTAIQLTDEYKSTVASILDEGTSPVPGLSDLVSSSDKEVSDILLKTKLDEKDEKLRILRRQEEEKHRAILAKEQAEANRVKEFAARDRAKNEELEDKTMRLTLIEVEGIKNVVLKFLFYFS